MYDMENDLIRVWNLLLDLGELNGYSVKTSKDLNSEVEKLKTDASHAANGFSLRRFNTDISKETFESELERQSAQIIIENHSLIHENRQLSMLLKEYESTLDTVMAKFRSHALAAQQHELTLTRHYESLIQARESASMQNDLSSNNNVAISLQRLSQNLRALIRALAGEEPEDVPKEGELSEVEEAEALLDRLLENREDWAMERESEIVRLEKENEELRKLLGIDKATIEAKGWLEEEQRELAISRYVPIMPPRSPISQGISRNQGSPSITPFVNLPGVGPSPGPQRPPLNSQDGMRVVQGRRAAMFGQRPRGGPPSIWDGVTHVGPVPPERPWQAQAGLDLS